MAISYEDWKKSYEWMSTDQQAKYANMVKGNATAEEYANRYIQEKQNAGTFGQKTAKSYTNANQPVETPTTRQETPVVNNQPETTTVDVARNETPKVDVITPEKPKKETPVTTVSEIKQEWALAPLSKEYYSQTSDEAQTKIINNLNWYRTSNPEYFTDYETFKKNFSYDARNDEQKNTLDVWYKWYSQGLQLSSTPIADLYTQYKNWSISTTDLESLRVANPEKYAELQQQINKGNIIAAYDDDKWGSETMFDQLRNTFLQNMITNLNASWSWASSIFDSYKDKMESPEMTELWDEAAAKQEEIEKVQADIDSMKKQVEAEYEWTWASRAKINAIISDRTYDLQLQLRSLNSEYNRVATQYNNRMNQYQSEFQLQLQEYQINMQERNQKMNELGFAMDLMNYETPQQKQEREWNYWVRQQEYTNWDINSKDYSTRYKAALKSVQNLLAQYPNIPMKRSAEQMAEDILNNMEANGTTLWQELTTINDFIKTKPEYKTLYNNTYWTETWISKTYTIGGKEYVMYNNELMTAEDFNKKFWGKGTPKAYNQVSEDVFSTSMMSTAWGYDGNTLGLFLAESKYQNWKYVWECGKFVNDYLQSIWVTDASNRYYDNDLSTKLNSVNAYTPKVWTIAVFDYNHKSSDGINHGHVWIVTKVNNDGSFVVRDSNFDVKNPWVIMERTIQPWSTSLKWFFDPSQASTTSTTSNLSAVDEAKKQNYLEEARRWQLNKSDLKPIWDLAATQWWNDEWQEALKQWQSWNLTDVQTSWIEKADDRFYKNIDVQDFDKAKNQFRQLVTSLNDSSWVWDMSAIFTFMKTLDPSSVVRESEFNAAQNTIWQYNWDAILQNMEKNINGKFLTPEQREQFKTVAKEFIKIKADAYQKQYDRLAKRYDWLWVDIKERWPENTAQTLLNLLWDWDIVEEEIDIWMGGWVANIKKYEIKQ